MTAPSHAGGVVVRSDDGPARFLLVSAKTQPNEWVLPKGHIEPGESVAETAAREVLEEAGVIAAVVSKLGIIEFDNWRGHVRAEFFLMRYLGEGDALERRRTAWMSLDDAMAALTFDDVRQLVRQAHRLVSADPGP
jgi:8-oxo-dGTP pyrophosphatase MutT (NUDIX family)